MLRAFLLFLTALMTASASAQITDSLTPAERETIADLKQNLEIQRDPNKKFYLLSDIVRKYASDEIGKEMIADAKNSAESLLAMSGKFKGDWNYGNSIHHSHLVLGRLHLMEGKVEQAKKELKLAGQTPGSPQLNSFGPNMTLAKELLEKGEKTAVLEYFDECLKFWTMDHAKTDVAAWKKDIANGKIPDFRAHLVY